jgi:hypothetical protein
MARRERRVDRIAAILAENGGRVRTSKVIDDLRKREKNDELTPAAVYIAIGAENDRLERQGKPKLFATYRDGLEERGWIKLEEATDLAEEGIVGKIKDEIRKANDSIDDKIRQRLRSMDWRTFETTFLAAVLEKLGFEDVEVTQATRDGGVDARVTYQRGLVDARAIVSAKRWSGKNAVPVDEVRNLRGIQGDEDTAIIITTGRFSDDARMEARPSQNQRVVYLIDGDRLVEICKEFSIGVRREKFPELLVLDEREFGDDADEESDDEQAGIKRLREEMLGDDERGISVKELVRFLKLKESTVRNYLATERRRSLLNRIREDPQIRGKVIQIISRRRGEA